MKTKSYLVATLLLPFLVIACNRSEDPMSTSSAPAPESQAAAPLSPDRTLESAPPAAGIPPSPPAGGGRASRRTAPPPPPP